MQQNAVWVENWAPEIFLSPWSLRDSLTAPWALIPIQISEKPIRVKCLEIILLLRAWRGSCAVDNAEALCHPASIVPSAPQLCSRELLVRLFLTTFYCFAVLGLVLVLTRVVQGRQGRLWTKSSSSNFLNFSGSLWGIYHGLFCLQLNFGSDGPDLGI